MKYKLTTDNHEWFVKKLNKFLKKIGAACRAEFYGSQMNHDSPYTHAIEFRTGNAFQGLTVRQEASMRSFLKKFFRRTDQYWTLCDRFLTYSFCSTEEFEKVCDGIGSAMYLMDIQHAQEEMRTIASELEGDAGKEFVEHLNSIKECVEFLEQNCEIRLVDREES